MIEPHRYRVLLPVVLIAGALTLTGLTGCGAAQGGAAVLPGASSTVTTSAPAATTRSAAETADPSQVSTDTSALTTETSADSPAGTADLSAESTDSTGSTDSSAAGIQESTADGQGSGPDGEVDACSLLSDGEIAAVIGNNTGGTGDSGSCEWENTDNYHSVSLTIGDPGTAVDGKLPDPLPGATTSDGPDGIRYSSGNEAEFLVGDRACHIQVVTSVTDDSDRPTAVKLIGVIRGRLGS